MAVALSSDELERTIEVLSSAGQTLRLTRFERRSYRALLLSVDGVLAGNIVFPLLDLFNDGNLEIPGAGMAPHILIGVAVFVFFVSSVVGVVSLGLNIPLLLKTFHEERRLKRLGLSSLSKSLWKESRRIRWTSRIREILVVGFVAYSFWDFWDLREAAGNSDEAVAADPGDLLRLFVALYSVVLIVLVLAARYLRNQRERMDLAASAEELRKALLSLQQRKGPDVVSVPAELLEQSAIIESAQIKRERKDAVLQSAAFRPNAYAIAFSREAARERATLGLEDRVELEDLVAELSTRGEPLESQAQPVPGTEGVTLVGATKSKRVEIEYVIEHASRSIRVTAVRHGAETSQTSLNGAGHV